MKSRKKAILALADGTVFEGYSFGAEGEAVGEVVFNTSMTGYQEILTDPSYCGQMVVMTYTQQGNYGTNPEDVESNRPWAGGFIVKDYAERPSNWRYAVRGAEPTGLTLDEYLKENNIPGIYDIDTRALTRHIRDRGAMQGVLATGLEHIGDGDYTDVAKSLVKKASEAPGLTGRDLVKEVTCKTPHVSNTGLWSLTGGYSKAPLGGSGRKKVVAFDFGIKKNIVRYLVSAGCDVTVVPATTTAEEVLKMNPDGVFLSNGPGDPEPVKYARKTIKKLVGKKPIFGICLGHQLLSIALGGKTFKLKFGHRGGNQPVKDLKTGKIEITSQNHGFAVDLDSMKGIAELTHINLNDNTVEGIELPDKKVFSVQYHPEASPGPHDAEYLFERFMGMMEDGAE